LKLACRFVQKKKWEKAIPSGLTSSQIRLRVN
jgi:hypothetical protein